MPHNSDMSEQSYPDDNCVTFLKLFNSSNCFKYMKNCCVRVRYIFYLFAGDSPEAQKDFASTLSQTLSSLAENSEGLEVSGLLQAFNFGSTSLSLSPSVCLLDSYSMHIGQISIKHK